MSLPLFIIKCYEFTATVLAQSVERRAEGCGFDSWGRTNTQGLMKGTPFTLQEAGPLHGSDDHVKILVPFPYPVGDVKILSPIRTFMLNTFTLKKKSFYIILTCFSYFMLQMHQSFWIC